MHETLINLLLELAYAVVIVVVPILAKYAISFLASKKSEIDAKTDSIVFQDTVSEAIDLIQRVVDTVSQTYVDSLKKSGNFTEEAQKKAFNDALETVKNLLSNDTRELLEVTYSDIDSWIKVQIESYIQSKK